MRQATVVALFDQRNAAEDAMAALVQAGLPREDINIRSDDGSYGTAGASTDTGQGGFLAALKDMFVPDDDATTYAEGIRRGGMLVTARVPESEAERAADIMERHHPVDIEESGAAWRSGGAASQPEGMAGERTAGDEQTIPVVEEELQVGKRQTGGGHVRVHSHMVETPVEEPVTLRDENVSVERRRVDRPAADGPGDAFQEKTVEATETHEEPVVAKKANVAEEVVVRKEAKDRTDKVRDTVRHTEVDVDDDREAKPTGPGAPRGRR